ncbi:MAG: hypothetical protein JO287_07135 [Pseudonocardiales bacterium]|nr:hypothetical protein [Pseudonocardiales bacterium]
MTGNNHDTTNAWGGTTPAENGGFAAQTDAFTETAKGIDELLDALASIGTPMKAATGEGVGALHITANQVGHAGFAQALDTFFTRWGTGIRSLVQVDRTIANGLAQTGIQYRHADATAEGILKRAAYDLLGDPRGDSTQAQTESWQQVAADTSGRIVHPDYSGDSFHDFAQQAGHTWEAEGHEVERQGRATRHDTDQPHGDQ